MAKIMVTGGAGFIGTNLIKHWLGKHTDDVVVNVDAMTYAARPEYLTSEIAQRPEWGKRYAFERVDLADHGAVCRVLNKHKPDHVIHLAAESHVCRSISGPKPFLLSNVNGTFHLIEEFKELWGGHPDKRFHHVSTDEVFGELGPEGFFTERSPIRPRSPYAATKAASDHVVQCYHETYGVNTVITNCSNNFGPNQHFEKLIPRTILKLLFNEPMTIYGDGTQIRDWLFVGDHCEAIDIAFHRGAAGQRYCIGGESEYSNLAVIYMVHARMKEMGLGRELRAVHTEDRPTDDFRYAIDCSEIKALGFRPDAAAFLANLEQTIRWYVENM